MHLTYCEPWLTYILFMRFNILFPSGNKPPDTQGTPPALVGGMPVGGGVTPQAAFCYRNVWIPLIIPLSQTSQKTTL